MKGVEQRVKQLLVSLLSETQFHYNAAVTGYESQARGALVCGLINRPSKYEFASSCVNYNARCNALNGPPACKSNGVSSGNTIRRAGPTSTFRRLAGGIINKDSPATLRCYYPSTIIINFAVFSFRRGKKCLYDAGLARFCEMEFSLFSLRLFDF